jgi:hypothetical protein
MVDLFQQVDNELIAYLIGKHGSRMHTRRCCS